MTTSAMKTDPERARDVEATFRVASGIYVVGSLERGVTVYNQQIRAHNLVWALWELQRNGEIPIRRVAIVGGGIAGLTTAACLLCLFEKTVTVSLFEQLWDLCPLQQGSDGRWLHPRIYDWPADGSRAPSASLPVLDWSEGRASDVARTIIREFGAYCETFAPQDRLTVYFGLQHFQINAGSREITWTGTRAARAGAFFHLGRPEGATSKFDIIILAAGFGLETRTPDYPIESYWRNEQLAQPILDGTQRRYLISGFGDGALVDLCRLTVERFRQDTIVYELFRSDLPRIEASLSNKLPPAKQDNNIFALLGNVEQDVLENARSELSNRIRKDTRVILHLRGRNNEVKTFADIFGRHSSFLNRLLTYLLYRCGAFVPDFSDLADSVTRHGIPTANVLCRYGADTINHLRALFVDDANVSARFADMRENQKQVPRRLWPPGLFPHHSTG